VSISFKNLLAVPGHLVVGNNVAVGEPKLASPELMILGPVKIVGLQKTLSHIDPIRSPKSQCSINLLLISSVIL